MIACFEGSWGDDDDGMFEMQVAVRAELLYLFVVCFDFVVRRGTICDCHDGSYVYLVWCVAFCVVFCVVLIWHAGYSMRRGYFFCQSVLGRV